MAEDRIVAMETRSDPSQNFNFKRGAPEGDTTTSPVNASPSKAKMTVDSAGTGSECQLVSRAGLCGRQPKYQGKQPTYNDVMARGWESKSVEAQQQDAIDKSSAGPKLTPAAAARRREQETLQLARLNVLKQLEAAGDERHRKLLQDSLAALEEKLSRIGS